jgi:RNA polymerase sigma factor (sigma-70 family)
MDFNKEYKKHKRYIKWLAYNLNQDSTTTKDLIQVGFIGLYTATLDFDPSKGVPFEKYMIWHIKGEMFKYLDKYSRQIRLPAHIITDIKHGIIEHPPTITLSNQTPINDNGGIIEDLIAQPESLEEPHPLLDDIYYYMYKLTNNEQKTLQLYFGLNDDKPLNLREISEIENLTTAAIHNRLNNAIKKIQKFLKDDKKI